MVAIAAGAAITAGALAAAPLTATASPAGPAGGASGYRVVQGAAGPAEQAAAVRYWTPAKMTAALRAAGGGPQSAQSAQSAGATGKKKAAKHAATGAHPPRVPAVPVRHLVKKAPPAGPWVTGNTAGQGLRWTHGGAVSAAVGKVFFSSGGADYVCSGTLVGSGRAEAVLTAAHCVSGGTGPGGQPRWVSNWIFVPGYRNGLMPYGRYTARRFYAARGWTGPQGGTEQYDVAFVRVAAGTLYGKPGAVVPPRGLPPRFARRQDAGAPKRAYVFGYPSEPPFTGLYANYCAGPVTPAGGSVTTTCGMTAGDSGGPWLASFSPGSGNGPVVAVSTYKVSSDLKVLYGAVLGPQALAIYQRAVTAR